MPVVDSALLGTAGTYYVMSQLAIRGFHASCTFGNAPTVDILVSAADGSRTLAIQVKTAFDAIRYRGRGKAREPHHLEFTLGRRLAKTKQENLVVAFVDMRGVAPGEMPDVYLVPSRVIFNHCKDWVDDTGWVRFHTTDMEQLLPFKNNWKSIAAKLGT